MSDTSDEASSATRTAFRGLAQFLWCLIPIASLGILMWLPAIQAWWKARTAGWAIVSALLAVGGVLVILGLSDVIANDGLLGLTYIGGGIGGAVAAVNGRRVVFAQHDETSAIDPAVQGVLNRREQREAARQMAAHDPQMALELGVGRPELGGSYDDGGLVDLNNAIPESIADVLDWRRDRAQSFVVDRDRRHGYDSLAELAALSVIPPREMDRIADRIVLLPHRPGPGSPQRDPDHGRGEIRHDR